MLTQAAEPFDLVGGKWIFEEKEPVRFEGFAHAYRINRRNPLVDVMEQKEVVADFVTNIIKHRRNRARIDIGLIVSTGEGRFEVIH